MCYSGDLLQGGLEIPCMLMFEEDVKDVAKVSRLVKYALSSGPEAATKDEPPRKRNKFESQDTTASEVEGTISGEKLSDLHINFVQKLLKQQFPWVNGLQCTLLQ